MNKEELKRGVKFEICGGKYPNWWGEVLAVSEEMGIVLTRYWFGDHYGDQSWDYIENFQNIVIWTPRPEVITEKKSVAKFKKLFGNLYLKL